MMKNICILIIIVMLTGCASGYVEIDRSEMSRAFMMNSSPMFKGYFYQGSDDFYHYFISRWKYAQDKQFKIRRNDLEILVEKPFGEFEFRIFVFKPNISGAKEFCLIEGNKLYINLHESIRLAKSGLTKDVQIMPWNKNEIVGYRFELVSLNETEIFVFRTDGYVMATIGSKKAVAAPLMFWSIDSNGILIIQGDGLPQVSLEKITSTGGIVEVLRNGKRAKYKIRKI